MQARTHICPLMHTKTEAISDINLKWSESLSFGPKSMSPL